MFVVNDDMSIYVTRGDMVFLKITADKDGKPYTFQSGDVLRIKVFEKKNCEKVVLQKDLTVTTETQSAEMFLDGNDTKIGGVISKPVDYWYEVELNPCSVPQTIIGYDEDGAKIFRLFPEGGGQEHEITGSGGPTAFDAASLHGNISILRGDKGAAAGFGAPEAAVGKGIAGPNSTTGLQPTVTVTVDDDSPDTAKIFKFAFDNIVGAGISGITKQSVEGRTATYCISLTDGRKEYFTVTDGAPGNGYVLSDEDKIQIAALALKEIKYAEEQEV